MIVISKFITCNRQVDLCVYSLPVFCELTFQDNVPKTCISDRIELSSSFTHLFSKSRQAAAYDVEEHTFKNAHRTPLLVRAIYQSEQYCKICKICLS